jgi:hypothetical protein
MVILHTADTAAEFYRRPPEWKNAAGQLYDDLISLMHKIYKLYSEIRA